MKIKKFLFSILLASLFFTYCSKQVASKNHSSIEGFYKYCDFYCDYVLINSDLTFEYRLYGDLYHGEGCKGYLTPYKNNIFLANSYKQKPEQNPILTYNRKKNDISITVLSENGNPMPYADVQIYSADSNFKGMTDTLNGTYSFTKFPFDKFTVRYLTYFKVTKDISDSSTADSFVVKMIPEDYPQYIYIKNKKWMFKRDSLLFERKDGSFNDEFPLLKSKYSSDYTIFTDTFETQ
jgi:hypothetical protein